MNPRHSIVKNVDEEPNQVIDTAASAEPVSNLMDDLDRIITLVNGSRNRSGIVRRAIRGGNVNILLI